MRVRCVECEVSGGKGEGEVVEVSVRCVVCVVVSVRCVEVSMRCVEVSMSWTFTMNLMTRYIEVFNHLFMDILNHHVPLLTL